MKNLKTSLARVVLQLKPSKVSKHHLPRLANDVPMKNKMLFPYDCFVKLYSCDKVEMHPFGLTNCGNSCYANAVLHFPNTHHGSHLGHGREEDAHEFLRYAIDSMQSVCLKEAGANAVGKSADETTLIQLTFGGYLRSKIRCMRCQEKSEQHERMMDLSYYCSRCKSYERARKKLTILDAPNILTIALKRFQSGKFGKLNKAVQFPENLNLIPYVSGTDDKSPLYTLYACSCIWM
uniref:USP domain-containing protein n=1 Tax=Ananas comosus var. bracteatus TaxID=296719 RepID=A0A6V7Q4Y1_ANACO|nr:unnamed protein product [Ananas comosus var. bracteatus]